MGALDRLDPVAIGDTVEISIVVRNLELPVLATLLSGVNFTIQNPDFTTTTTAGSIIADTAGSASGFLRWTDTTETGNYVCRAQFTFLSGEIRSVPFQFDVYDPFDTTPLTDVEYITDQVMLRLEDCFDSTDGGPWLRDVTYNNFDRDKVSAFIAEALLDFNVEQPPTNAVLDDFCVLDNNGNPPAIQPLLVKSLLVKVIRHLVRSYVEQPVPTGAQIMWEDRTRYSQAWMAVADKEQEDYFRLTRLYKRQLLNLGHSALSVLSKQGRLFIYPNQRLSNVGRSFY